jgi:hypothetical protein
VAKKPKDTETETEAVAEEAAVKKGSIVPSKYGNKYKNGGSDVLAEFINAQAKGNSGFEYPAFFELCRKNGVPAEQVNKYEGQVAAKQHGANGRARMTLRNMLATVARKNGGLVGLDDQKVAMDLPKPTVPTRAKKQETASTEEQAA